MGTSILSVLDPLVLDGRSGLALEVSMKLGLTGGAASGALWRLDHITLVGFGRRPLPILHYHFANGSYVMASFRA